METPLCSDCLETDDELCEQCSQKLDDGEIEQVTVDLVRMLHDLSTDIPTLEDIEVQDVRTATDAVVVITGKGDGPKVVGKNGEVVKQLAERFDRSIRVIENSGNPQEVIENLLEPVDIEGINTVYKPGGTELKVVVSEDDRRRVPISQDDFRVIVQELTGEEYSLSFE